LLQTEDPNFSLISNKLVKFYRDYPEIAAADLLGVDLSEIQKVVLRSMWFRNYVMSIMCRGSGKTFLNAVLACLKGMLYPGYRVGLIAPTFRQSKMMFDECDRIWQSSPIFQAATERKPTAASDNCYIRFKATGGKAGSIIQAIPLGDGSKIRGSRFFTIICDEFPHIPEEIFNMVIRPMAATVAAPMENVRRIRREKDLLEKGMISEDEIEEKAANQIIITSSGYFTFNHMYKLYQVYKEEMLNNNEKYAVFRVPYKLLPEGFLDQENVESARKQMSNLEFRMEYEAAFIPDTDGFYKASLIESCKSREYTPQVVGDLGKSYCLGIDPARSEDSFAICVAELGKPAKIVHAIELQKEPFPKMAALIENLCISFNVVSIYMDAGGGGLAIKDILAENKMQHPAGPLLDPEDEVHQIKAGRHILKMCNFGTDFISDSNFAALRLLEHRDLLFPSPPKRDEIELALVEDASYLTITQMQQQMQTIVITETPTGKIHFDVPKGGGHGKEKKDLYTAFMLVARCIYDHLWSEDLPESILHQGGLIKPREPNQFFGKRGFISSENPIPQALQDKLDIAEDPEAFKQRMFQNMRNKRTLISSPTAVLTPKPKKNK
jgi:hypothetical protein